MEKISLVNIVDFKRKKNDGTRFTLIQKINKPKDSQEGSEGGGNYWIHSLSAISNAFKSNNHTLIDEKIDILSNKHDAASHKISKNMFGRNIDILHNFEGYDFTKLKPRSKLTFISNPKDKSIMTIRKVPVQVQPNGIFQYKEKGRDKIGATWFVSKLRGYSKEELGMFAEALFKNLEHNYSSKYAVEPDFCTIVDVTDLSEVKYSHVLSKSIPSSLNSVLDDIAKLM